MAEQNGHPGEILEQLQPFDGPAQGLGGDEREEVGTLLVYAVCTREQSNDGSRSSAKTIQNQTFLKHVFSCCIIIIHSTTTIIHIPRITLW